MRRCVYTAVSGGYEPVKPHPSVPGVDFIAFTDGDPIHAETTGWEHRPMEFANPRPRMRAKHYKVNVSAVLSEYDVTFWVDTSIELLSTDFIEQALGLGEEHGFAAPPHPARNCIYAEAVASLGMPKYDGEPMLEQVGWYWKLGHPRNWGLWAGGLLARRQCDETDAVMNEWWRQITHWSWQDQLSLPFVCRMAGMRPAEIPTNVYDTVAFRPHFKPEAR